METVTNESKIKKFMEKPTTQIVVRGLTFIVAGAALAVSGYRMGKTTGRKVGQVEGYGAALSDLGITHSDIGNVAAAWRESQGAIGTAMTTSQPTAVATPA